MLRRLVAGSLSIGLLAAVLFAKGPAPQDGQGGNSDSAKQGIITNRQGEKFKGEITEDEKFYYVDTTGGQLKLDKRNVSNVVYDVSIDDQYAQRHTLLTATDVKGRITLANWANENGRVDLAINALQEALDIDPANHDVALQLQADQRQMDLDQTATKGKKKSPEPATAPSPVAAATAPATQGVAEKPKGERRLLTNDEINIVRQREMLPGDPRIKIRFDNEVVRRYLATGNRDAAAFNQLSPQERALEIMTNGTPKMINDVRIMTDPTPLLEFKQKILPLIANGCASTACHGGNKAGDFALYSGDSANAVYTNFYILQTYASTIKGVKYLAVDREVPSHSLVLQYGLPASVGVPAHPAVPNWRPRFRTDSDPAFLEVYTWLSKSLNVLQPDYGINVLSKLPTSQPAAAPSTTAPTK